MISVFPKGEGYLNREVFWGLAVFFIFFIFARFQSEIVEAFIILSWEL